MKIKNFEFNSFRLDSSENVVAYFWLNYEEHTTLFGPPSQSPTFPNIVL